MAKQVMTAGSMMDGSRLLMSVALALGVHAAGLGMAGLMIGPPQAPRMDGVPAVLRVGLGPVVPKADGPVPVPAPEALPAPAPVPAFSMIPEPEAPRGVDLPSLASGGSSVPGTPAVPSEADETGQEAVAASSGRPYEAADGAERGADLLQRLEALVRANLTYPPLARRRNIEGAVIVSMTVDRGGALMESSVAGSSGSSILDTAALALVRGVFPLGLTAGLDEPLAIRIRIVYDLES